MSNTDTDAQIWERPWSFYFGVAAPCVFGLLIANIMATGFNLLKPERVTVSIECCYQNVGIATSVALTMFSGEDLAEAMGVPFYYGLVEAFVLGLYCIGAWKAGWTKAPTHVSLWRSISTSYEIKIVEKVENEETVIRDANDAEQVHGFHYVQHTDTKPENDVEEEKREDDISPEIGIRRDARRKDKKEPSYMGEESSALELN